MRKKKESFFWTSYSDLMTSLFFVMLTLFVLGIVLLSRSYRMTMAENERMKRIVNSTKDLSRDYFAYEPAYEKFVLRVKCEFPEDEADIAMLPLETHEQLYQAGRSISDFMQRHSDVQYLLIIEGQASRNSEQQMLRNYDLSYRRALNLVQYWKFDCGLQFPDNCETQIAGSGDGRLNDNSMRSPVNVENQRFLIYLIPKNIMDEKND